MTEQTESIELRVDSHLRFIKPESLHELVTN